jgi:hypothetical protein
VIAAAGPTALWYAARSTGYVSLILLTAIVALGIVTSMRWSNRDWPRFVSQALHRNLSLVVLVFLLIHILTSVIDPFAGIAVLNTVAPFTGSYRPIWLGLGVVSVELLVALTITSLLRQRIGFRVWRLIHWAAYACWPLAVLHTLGTGSDVRPAWALLLTSGCVVLVVLAIVWRLMGDDARGPLPIRVAALGVTMAATIALVGFAAAGPLHSGWAKAAGTPDQLLALTSSQATPTPVPAAIPEGVTDQLSGTLYNSSSGVSVTLSDARDASLRIVIAVAPGAATGRVVVTEGGSQLCATTATIAQDVVATCGSTRLDISLTAETSGTVVGQMVTQAAQ